MGADLFSGCRSSNSSVGGSVAKARAANESIIKLTHNNCTLVNGNLVVLPLLQQATTKVKVRAAKLMDNWKVKNLRMFSRMLLPQRTEATMESTVKKEEKKEDEYNNPQK